MTKPAFNFTDDNDEPTEETADSGLFVIKLINTVDKVCIHTEAVITGNIKDFMEKYQPGGGDQSLQHYLYQNGYDYTEIFKVLDYVLIGAAETTCSKIQNPDADNSDVLGELLKKLAEADPDIIDPKKMH